MPRYRVDVVMDLHGSECLNTWHVDDANAPPNAADVQEFVDNMVEPVIARLSDEVQFREVQYRNVDVPGQIGVTFLPTGWPKNGAVVQESTASFNSLLIKGSSLDGVPPGRIRKFIPGVTEQDHESSEIRAIALPGWQTVIDGFNTWVAGDPTWRPVAVRYSAGPNPVVTAHNDISTFSFSPVLAIMSSRKKGRGS